MGSIRCLHPCSQPWSASWQPRSPSCALVSGTGRAEAACLPSGMREDVMIPAPTTHLVPLGLMGPSVWRLLAVNRAHCRHPVGEARAQAQPDLPRTGWETFCPCVSRGGREQGHEAKRPTLPAGRTQGDSTIHTAMGSVHQARACWGWGLTAGGDKSLACVTPTRRGPEGGHRGRRKMRRAEPGGLGVQRGLGTAGLTVGVNVRCVMGRACRYEVCICGGC